MSLAAVNMTFREGLGGVSSGAGKRTAKLGLATGAPSLLTAVTAAGTTPPTVTVAGTPTLAGSYRIEITTGGARGTAVFKWSLDGGANWTETAITTAATYLLPGTGITVSFSTGTYATDNVYTFTAIRIPVYSFSDFASMKSTLTSGPLVEACADTLAESGRDCTELLVVPVYGSTAGSSTTPILSGTSPAVTLTGTPKDDYQGKVVCVTGGARGTATFKYSLDGGDTYSGTITTAATYEMTNDSVTTGLTLAMASGTYVAGDSWTWTSIAPSFTTSDLNNALDALKADGRECRFVHVVGTAQGADDAAKVTALQSILSAVQTRADLFEAANLYTRFLCDGADVSDIAIASMSATTAKRCAYGHGSIELDSVLTAKRQRRPFAWALATRLAKIPMSVSPASMDDNEHNGQAALPTRVRSISRDERVSGGVAGLADQARAISCRTWNGLAGYYCSSSNTLAALGSSYAQIQIAFVADELARVMYAAIVKMNNAKIRVNATTGYIDEADAKSKEATVLAAAQAALTQGSVRHASAVTVSCSRVDNLLATDSVWTWTGSFVPFGYPNTINVSVAVRNPAVTPV